MKLEAVNNVPRLDSVKFFEHSIHPVRWDGTYSPGTRRAGPRARFSHSHRRAVTVYNRRAVSSLFSWQWGVNALQRAATPFDPPFSKFSIKISVHCECHTRRVKPEETIAQTRSAENVMGVNQHTSRNGDPWKSTCVFQNVWSLWNKSILINFA